MVLKFESFEIETKKEKDTKEEKINKKIGLKTHTKRKHTNSKLEKIS